MSYDARYDFRRSAEPGDPPVNDPRDFDGPMYTKSNPAPKRPAMNSEQILFALGVAIALGKGEGESEMERSRR